MSENEEVETRGDERVELITADTNITIRRRC